MFNLVPTTHTNNIDYCPIGQELPISKPPREVIQLMRCLHKLYPDRWPGIESSAACTHRLLYIGQPFTLETVKQCLRRVIGRTELAKLESLMPSLP